MWSFLLRGGIAVVLLMLLWLFAARPLAGLIDRVYTVSMGSLPATPVGWNGTFLQFGAGQAGTSGPKGWLLPELLLGGHILDLDGAGPGYEKAAAVAVDGEDRLVLSAGGRSFVLGTRAGTLPGSDGPIPAYAADPGDTPSMTIETSWLSWPNFFDFHFGYLDGPGAIWQRSFYYRLSWQKRSGARLDMLWRFEQGYDAANGWRRSGQGSREGVTGLVRVEIRPAPAGSGAAAPP